MVGLRVALLGGFEARLATGAPVRLPTKKAQALLAYLAARPGRDHPRDKLAALLWGDTSDHQARGSLRHALADLRKALAGASPPALRIDGQTLALDSDTVEVDVVSFECRVAEGTPQALEHAADLYRGDLLLGFGLAEPLFEDWLVSERERLREMVLEALARLLSHQTKAGGTGRAIRTAVRLLALDPLQEAVHRTLMQLYARQGRRGAALKQYQLCVAELQRELGTDPEAETKALYQDLLRRPVPSEARVAPRSRPGRAAGALPPDLPAAVTPLFGREADLAGLRQQLEEAIGGRGQLATVVGEAGIGKTRLAGTVAAEALARGCQVLIGRCHESDSILPFGPWVDACRGGRVGADEQIVGALHPTRRAELARLLPEAALAGLPPATDSPLALFESVAQLVEAAAARQPLLLVLEDLHWADEMSLRLLAFVNRRLPGWPALLLVTARDEELADAAMAQRTVEDLSRAPHARSARLAPLSRADIGGIVRALTRVGRVAPPLAGLEEQVWAMSEGNPLVAVEAMHALAQESRDEGEGGVLGELSLPGRVRELVARRLGRLSARSQAVAAVAAVIGRRFDFELLRSASGLDERDTAEAVEDLVRSHVLRNVGSQLEFTHDRVRDVAYGRLLPPRRRLLHGVVAEAIEAAGAKSAGATGPPLPDRPDEQIDQLAHHALCGDLREKAVSYLRLAGERAAARSALRNARTRLEQALDTLGTLPESRTTLEEAFAIRLALRPVLVQLGELRQVLELLREARALAERLNDDGRRGQVWAFMANIHSRLDEPTEALASGTRALEIAGRLADSRLRILATAYLEQAHFYRGEYARVIDLARGNLAALPPGWAFEFFGGSQTVAVHDRFRLLVSLAYLGRFGEAEEHAAEAIRLAEPTRDAYTVAMAHYAAATLHLVKGDWAEARTLTARQIAVLRTGNVAGELPTALALSARALGHLGDAAAALAACREAEQLLVSRSARERVGNGWVHCSLGRAYLLLGRLDDAARLATPAGESASGRVDFVPDALQLLGDLATHPDRFDAERGRVYYGRALALAEPRGMRPLVAHCHLGLGQLSRRAGDATKAREHVTTAAAMYREMGMNFWLEKARAEREPPPGSSP